MLRERMTVVRKRTSSIHERIMHHRLAHHP
jgi:hypothetical protein